MEDKITVDDTALWAEVVKNSNVYMAMLLQMYVDPEGSEKAFKRLLTRLENGEISGPPCGFPLVSHEGETA